MTKKYELTDERIYYYGKTLYRIKALKDFSDVKIGDLGGFIEKEDNLSHYGDCWVYHNAEVFGDAKVLGDAKVFHGAEVYGRAQVYGGAEVFHYAKVYDNAQVYGHAEVFSYAQVFGYARVFDDAKIYGNAEVFDYAQVYGSAQIYDDTKIYDEAKVFDNTKIYGNAEVYDDAEVLGYARVFDNAFISKTSDYINIISIGSENDTLTAFKLQDNSIYISRGCFKGTLEEFSKAVKKRHGDNQYAKEYELTIELIKLRLNSN